jgi:hypothetical protein
VLVYIRLISNKNQKGFHRSMVAYPNQQCNSSLTQNSQHTQQDLSQREIKIVNLIKTISRDYQQVQG